MYPAWLQIGCVGQCEYVIRDNIGQCDGASKNTEYKNEVYAFHDISLASCIG